MAAADPLPASAQRVQDALAAKGFAHTVEIMPGSTRTSADAAVACGCTVAQIAKSLIFRAKPSGAAVLVIASGAHRVDEKAIEAVLGEKIGKADAEFVRAATGFAIGGVPPIAHAGPVEILIDEDLLGFDEIWAAAGTPFAVFRLTPQDLVAMTGGRVARIA